tara:strand:+ start:69 stop:728 length:660 start_codon:yes stop_codon:yes gene_type:complete
MKKLLAIIVLGLLLTGCVSEMKKVRDNRSENRFAGRAELVKGGFNPGFVRYGNTIEEVEYKSLAACEQKRRAVGKGKCIYNGSWENRPYKVNQESKENKRASLANIKSTCKEFGYNEGTEKFADCVKDLYLQNTQAGKTKRKIDPSVWEDLGNISEDILSGKSTSEAISGSSSPKRTMTCFKTGEETGGLNKICRYDCAGNLVTTTIGSAQVCSIQIQR